MFSAVCDFAVSREEGALLTSIADKLAGWIRHSGPESRRVTATLLFDVILVSFYRLDMKHEAASLLDLAAECRFKSKAESEGLDDGVARLRLAGVERWLARSSGDSAFERARVAISALGERKPVPVARIAAIYVLALGMAAGQDWQSAALALFRGLPRVPSTFTTQFFYSRLHLDLAEAAVLAVTTTDFRSAQALNSRLGPNEIRNRRQFLAPLHEAVVAWGESDWGPVAQ
jgi:hypothetical protein